MTEFSLGSEISSKIFPTKENSESFILRVGPNYLSGTFQKMEILQKILAVLCAYCWHQNHIPFLSKYLHHLTNSLFSHLFYDQEWRANKNGSDIIYLADFSAE